MLIPSAWTGHLVGAVLGLAVLCGCGASAGRLIDAGPMVPDVLHNADGALGGRADVVVAALTAGDAEFLWDRPALATGKYTRMANDAFAFFRGALALFLHDWNDPTMGLQATRFAAGDARPMGLGDAHPENFGTMRTADGVFRLEPNDFDTADRLPYLWDVRRFAIGMCLAARVSNPSDDGARATAAAAARAIARAAVVSYADTLAALAAGGPRPVIENDQGNAVLADLFARSAAAWDDRAELSELTIKDKVRLLIRGTPDPLDPVSTTRNLPARAYRQLSATLSGYRATLTAPPSARELVPLDAVQQFGQGVGSFPRMRALVLARGPSTDDEDDLLLEVKELPPQGTPPLPGKTGFANPGERVRAALAAGWTEAGADPLWGVGSWSGFPAQIRTEAAGFKTVRVARLDGERGTPDAISGLGVALAGLIARMHAAPVAGQSALGAIAGAIARDPGGFADEQTDVATAYCDQVVSDWTLFTQALTLLGPTLGAEGDPAHAWTAELKVMFDPLSAPAAAGVDPVTGPITINEIGAIGSEFVELMNPMGPGQDLSGSAVADADTDGGPRFDKAVRFPAGASLPSGARLVIEGGAAEPALGLQSKCKDGVKKCYEASWDVNGGNGETIYLLSPDDVILDQAVYPMDAATDGQTWCRLPDGAGPFAVGMASAGKANLPP